jgi:hypothetical protein
MAKDVEKAIEYLQKVKDFEDWVGVGGLGNVKTHIESLRREVEELKAVVQEFVTISGCTNKGRAKDHFRTLMRKVQVEFDLTLVRETFHKVSATWLNGVVKKGSILGEAPISADRAMLEHESLMPRIIRLHQQCSKLENGEQILDQFEEHYLTMGRKQFGNLVFKFVEDIVELEEQEEEQKTKIEKGASSMELQKTLRIVKERDYGVGGVLEPPTWD